MKACAVGVELPAESCPSWANLGQANPGQGQDGLTESFNGEFSDQQPEP
jgi:hypothetical protein